MSDLLWKGGLQRLQRQRDLCVFSRRACLLAVSYVQQGKWCTQHHFEHINWFDELDLL